MAVSSSQRMFTSLWQEADDVWLSCCRKCHRLSSTNVRPLLHALQAPPKLPADPQRCPLNPASSANPRSLPVHGQVSRASCASPQRPRFQGRVMIVPRCRHSSLLAEQIAGGRSARRGPADSRATWYARYPPERLPHAHHTDAHRSTACHALHLTAATRSLRLIALFSCEHRSTK